MQIARKKGMEPTKPQARTLAMIANDWRENLGDRADLSFRRLQKVELTGDRNSVVVRKGRTEVADRGDHNTVRVNKRA